MVVTELHAVAHVGCSLDVTSAKTDVTESLFHYLL